MPDPGLPEEARHALDSIRETDIVIGIPSYNNVHTIGHVVRAAQAGCAKYFPQFNAVIVNSDGGSSDGTREAVLSASVDFSRLLMVSTPFNRHSSPFLSISRHTGQRERISVGVQHGSSVAGKGLRCR